MAAETPGADEQTEAPDPAPAASNKTSLVVVIIAALLGAAVGSFVVAPRMIASNTATPDSTASADHGAAGDHGGSSGEIYTLENIIVNPAGSEGLRFLMVSVAFEVSEEAVEELRYQEVQLRDLVISTLEEQTMEMLTRRGARDSIKSVLAHAVTPLVGEGAHVQVYLPRFVIQ